MVTDAAEGATVPHLSCPVREVQVPEEGGDGGEEAILLKGQRFRVLSLTKAGEQRELRENVDLCSRP